MIPEFNTEGNLPEGIYFTDENEFKHRFCIGSARRKWLCEKLNEFLVLAKSTNKVERIFVWGSFISSKESPNDIDILLMVSRKLQINNIPEPCKILFDHVAARLKFNFDIFWSKSSIGEETLNLWLDTYQTTKDFKRRGIIEVELL